MFAISPNQLVNVIAGRLCADDRVGAEPRSLRVTIDSRSVRPGDLFWALPGSNCDGADYAGEAWQRGAVGVVAQRPLNPPPQAWSMAVKDAYQALWDAAAWQREQFRGPVVGVTGSVGKTSARGMIAAVLGQWRQGCSTPGNFNNHLGVPLSMLGLTGDDAYGVFELGASAPGEIARLASLLRPQIGVITRIGPAHLGGFGSLDGVLREKAELIARLPDDGLAVLNGDDPLVRRAARRTSAKVLWFGRGSDCDVAAAEVSSAGGQLRFKVDGQAYMAPVWGRHYLDAALAAVAVGRAFGLTPRDIAAGLEQFDPPPSRCQIKSCRGATVMDDTYNANPASMRAALELLRELSQGGRRIVVLGDMHELGPAASQLHGELGRDVVTLAGADVLLAVGEHAEAVVAGARRAGMPSRRMFECASHESAVAELAALLRSGDTVLVKGSRAAEMERVVRGLEEWKAMPALPPLESFGAAADVVC